MWRISRSLNTLTLVCATLFACGVAQANALKPYSADYESVVSGFSIDLHRELTTRGTQFVLSMQLQKLFIGIQEHSVFEVEPNGRIKPLYYEHIRSGLSQRHNTRLQFDWSRNEVRDLLANKQQPLQLEFPSYDKLSYQTQFRLDLLTRPLAQRYDYRLVSGKRLKLYSYHFRAEEAIDTPLGKLRTLKFERNSDNRGRKTIIWFAKDWDFLIARIDHFDKQDDKPDRLLLRSATIGGKSVGGLDLH